MANPLELSNVILDSLSDGVYVCDRDRRIVYWSKSAEQITGWLAKDVIGRRCLDNVLCHEDKDGRRLCGERRQRSRRDRDVERHRAAVADR